MTPDSHSSLQGDRDVYRRWAARATAKVEAVTYWGTWRGATIIEPSGRRKAGIGYWNDYGIRWPPSPNTRLVRAQRG